MLGRSMLDVEQIRGVLESVGKTPPVFENDYDADGQDENPLRPKTDHQLSLRTLVTGYWSPLIHSLT